MKSMCQAVYVLNTELEFYKNFSAKILYEFPIKITDYIRLKVKKNKKGYKY